MRFPYRRSRARPHRSLAHQGTGRQDASKQVIKESLKDRSARESKAEEIAARTVNKERARAGEVNEAAHRGVKGRSKMNQGQLAKALSR